MADTNGSLGANPVLPGPGQRATVRYPLPAETTCPLAGLDAPGTHRGTVRDVSRGGLGLLLDVPVGPGERLLVGLSWEEARPVYVACRVVHVTDCRDGTWAAGCAFDTPLSTAQREEFLEGTP
jgi:hypothetical protein